jgi:hypothetical protein
LAAHFDTMFQTDSAQGTEGGTEAAQLIAILFEAAPALGGTQSTFTATTSSGTATWHGVALAGVIDAADTAYITGIYPNDNLQQAIGVVAYSQSSPVVFGTANGFSTLATDGTLNSFAGQILSTGSACSLQSNLAADPVINQFISNSGFTCLSGVMNISFSVSFPPTDSLGAMSSTSISNATFHGPVVFPAGGQHVVSVPSKGAALFMKLESLRHH